MEPSLDDSFQASPHEVSRDSVAYGLRCDEPETGRLLIVRRGMQNRVGDAIRTPHAVTGSNDSTKVVSPGDSIPLRWHERKDLRLRGKLRATLAATCDDDRAAGAGAHACAEAVHLGTSAVVGLESTLAHQKLRDLGARRALESRHGRQHSERAPVTRRQAYA